MIDEFWRQVPVPERLMHLTTEQRTELRALLQPLGFVNKRMNTLVRNASDYVALKSLKECYGMGKYGRDSIDIFVCGLVNHVRPDDKWLLPYLEWRRSGGSPVAWGKSAKNVTPGIPNAKV